MPKKFTEGNRLWELASRLGRKRLLTADELMEEFKKYVEFNVECPVSNNTKVMNRKGGRGGDEVKMDKQQKVAPMTEYSFCVWIGRSKSWFPTTISDLRKKIEDNRATEEDVYYLETMENIQTFLQSQMLDGAILGDYQHQIVSSLLGLRNNVDVTSGGGRMDAPVINIIKDTKTREDYSNE